MVEETLGEKLGTTNPVVVEKSSVKKKMRVVKKIVKKKVIKKVPKRVSVAPKPNDLENVSSPNNITDNPPMEIDKPDVNVDDSREIEVNDGEKEINDDEIQLDGLLTSSLSNDQNYTNEMNNNMDVEKHEIEMDVMKQTEKSEVGLGNDINGEEDIDLKQTDSVENDQEQIDKSESSPVKIEAGLTNDINGEEDRDLKQSDVVEDDHEISEPEQIASEVSEPSGETVASMWHKRQKTKLFVHGLDKETKEEDIRKVFEEIGEVVEVKIITNLKSGKSRGCGFVRYASEDQAKLALKKYQNVEICGRPCTTAVVEGTGTILLNNIDKKWNNEYVLELLQKIGIEKIDEVSVVDDPENTELNLGFAFLKLQTKRDAQIAYDKLQNKNVFGKHSNIKVAWAEPNIDPVEEEAHHVCQIKSVYAQHIPFTWDEEKVRDHFRIFGEIESIALAKNLRSTRRTDFAFVNYKTYEAALSCIRTLSSKQSTNKNGPKDTIKVSLAKSIPKGKPFKTISNSPATELSMVKQKAIPVRSVYEPHVPHNTRVISIRRHEDEGKIGGSSTTDELVQLLREQASWKHGGPTPKTIGMNNGHHHQPPLGRTQQLTGNESVYHDPRPYHQTHLQIQNATHHPRLLANHVAMSSSSSFPQYNQQRGNYTSGSVFPVESNPRYPQTRDRVTYHGSSSVYRQMR